MTALAHKLARLKQQAGVASSVAAEHRGHPRAAESAVHPAVQAGTMEAGAGHGPTARIAEAPAPVWAPAPRPIPATAERHARQVSQLRKLMGLRPGNREWQAPSRDRILDGEEIAPGLRRIEIRQPAQAPAGELDLTELRHEPVAASRILAFDTETTGLAGGTGTRAFMIGAADWHDGSLRIRQLLMTTLSAERAMLAEFARWLADDTVLLSYNGKSYDRPLLSTRYTLARLPDPVIGRAHIDLLHPARRRWRGVWENCRLATIERQVLGVVREDDLPGSEAPAAWLSYLRGGSAEKLRRVGHHNAQDLRSLTGLLEHFAGLAASNRLPM